MVELETPQMDQVFHALSDTTRRHMLHSLAGGERTVSQLAEPFAMSLAAASKHIKALEHAGLIRREVRGRTHVCRLEARPLATAYEWLGSYARFWNSRLDVLEQLLREEAGRKTSTTQTTPEPANPAKPEPSKPSPQPESPRPTPSEGDDQ
ncbi:ArsR/SmtB family transcription factor [Mesorhizobium neociceri]|uniref:Helix-turn-helix transcriptional regulator n=1 Tax=Mesorhizobium neociceri TaxID=1307853 RepID=A0A838BD68_9HYPH|nr:metalloregulator ArsR/SmtB family transcription factor [Mesorhizobium neociceri]MBA1144213.1 helix-turn-helix transcriptional regulator [Mesorhizobium neociceri]